MTDGPDGRSDRTVLIVDDHEMVAQSLVRLIDAPGEIKVVGLARSAEEALAAYDRFVPDLVLMDYGLPDMDGIECTRRLRGVHPEARVLILTGYSGAGLLKEAIRAGACGLIEKTLTASDLVGSIQLALVGGTVVPRRALDMVIEGGPPSLTPREVEVLNHLAAGRSTTAIAETMSLSINTVRNHTQRLIEKLGAHSRHEAVALGRKRGLVKPDL